MELLAMRNTIEGGILVCVFRVGFAWEKWGITEMKYFSFKEPSFGMVLRKHHGNDIYRWLMTLISDGTIFLNGCFNFPYAMYLSIFFIRLQLDLYIWYDEYRSTSPNQGTNPSIGKVI